MSRKAVATIIILSISLVLVAIAGVGSIYYLISTVNKNQQKLEKDLKASKEENKKLKAENKKLKNQSSRTTSSSEEGGTSEADLIEQAITNKLQADGLDPSDYKIKNIKYKDDWATARATPHKPVIEPPAFVLQKKNGTWTVLTYSTGIFQEDYPDTPPEIWEGFWD